MLLFSIMKRPEEKSFEHQSSQDESIKKFMGRQAISVNFIDNALIADETELGRRELEDIRRDDALSHIASRYKDHPLVREGSRQYKIRDIEVSGDIIGDYLNEAGSYRRLTAEDEELLFTDVDLAHSLYGELRGIPEYVHEDLEIIFINAATSMQVVHGANMALAFSIAKPYLPFDKGGIEGPDHLQEANEGLIKAIRHFRIKDGNKFSTYAYKSIERAITKGIMNNSNTIRKPREQHINFLRATQIVNEMSLEQGSLSSSEIEKAVGMPYDSYLKLVQTVSHKPIPFETPIGDEDGLVLGDAIEDRSMEDSDLLLQNISNQQDVVELLMHGKLTDKEIFILGLRFGLSPDLVANPNYVTRKKKTVSYSELYDMNPDGLTLREISEKLGVSRERVRQIEAEAIEKLRAHGRHGGDDRIQ